MSNTVLASDLEPCKENILPLRRGRDPAATLAAAANPSRDAELQRQAESATISAIEMCLYCCICPFSLGFIPSIVDMAEACELLWIHLEYSLNF
jgi:hypothetical protein